MNNLDYNLNHFNLLISSKWFYNLNYVTSRERAHIRHFFEVVYLERETDLNYKLSSNS